MKTINDLQEMETQCFVSSYIDIYEKLDLPYFKIRFVDKHVFIFTSKGKMLTNVDFVVNSMYNEVNDFVDNNIRNQSDKLYETFGCFTLGVLYCPVSKTNMIKYEHIEPGTFIINDFFVDLKNLKNEEKLMGFFPDNVKMYPHICTLTKFPDSLDDKMTTIMKLTNSKTWSGNDVNDIEGIIIVPGGTGKKYQMIVNEVKPDVDKSTTKIYRDIVLENFANTISPVIDYIELDALSYIEKVSRVFLEYINTTELLSKTYIEEEDLLPPRIGYIGDVDYDKLPSTVSLICKANGVYKNILRILLITFNQTVDKFDSFPDESREKMRRIFSRINNLMTDDYTDIEK